MSDFSHFERSPFASQPLLFPNILSVEHRLGVACEHILAAFKNEEPVYVRRVVPALYVNALVHRLRWLRWTVVFILVNLSFFERPVWCEKLKSAEGVFPCDLLTYEGFRLGFLPLRTAFTIETICILILALLEAGHTYAGAVASNITLFVHTLLLHNSRDFTLTHKQVKKDRM